MKKLRYIFYSTIWLLSIAFYIVPAQGMKNCQKACDWKQLITLPHDRIISILYRFNAQEAETYNNNNCLLALPQDIFMPIFAHCQTQGNDQVRSLEKSIKDLMKISMACKKFNKVLTSDAIGGLCKSYDNAVKNQVIKCIIQTIDRDTYEGGVLPVSVLLYAGADPNAKLSNGTTLLREAVIIQSLPLIRMLLAYGANPNVRDLLGYPIFYYATNDTAQILIDNGVDITLCSAAGNNIVSHLVINDFSAKRLEFYLKDKVYPKEQFLIDGGSLFHWIAENNHHRDVENFLKKAELLSAIPEIINTLNSDGKTPLDVVQEKLEIFKEKKYSIEVIEQLIILFKKYGGLTAQELKLAQSLAQKFVDCSPEDIYQVITTALDNIILDELIEALRICIVSGYITKENIVETLIIASKKDDGEAAYVILNALGNQATEIVLSCNKWKTTALHMVNGSVLAQSLINAAGQHASDYVCMQDIYGNTPLACAIFDREKKDRAKIVQSIVQVAGERIWHLLSTRNDLGETALIDAVRSAALGTPLIRKQYISIIDYLITAAGDHALEYLHMHNNSGETALSLAKQYGKEIFTFLEEKRKDLTPPVECSLCLETKKFSDCHTMSNCTDKIGCKSIFCKECLLEHIATHLDEGSTLELRCPNVNCAKKMEEQEIRAITEQRKDLYQQFNQIIFDEFLLQNNTEIKRCPTPNCTYAYSIEDLEAAGQFKCSGCKQIYCSHCHVQHAQEMSCQEAYEHRQRVGNASKEEMANQEWLQQNTKPCAQCKTSIQKNGGCYYMFCKKCGHEFCWRCLQPHDHTMSHPCGLWEDDEQMNQARQQLVQQLEQEEDDELDEQNEAQINQAHQALINQEQPAVAEAMAGGQEQPVINNQANNLGVNAGNDYLDDQQLNFMQRNMQQMAQIGQPQEAPIINLHFPQRMQPMAHGEQPQEAPQDNGLNAPNDFDVG